jgi:hypothetical protein
MPPIPPRPTRKLDPSPAREDWTRSPLNDLPEFASSNSKRRSQGSISGVDLPQRPPSVSLPSIGQEGQEYASFDQLPPEAHSIQDTLSQDIGSELTKNVSADVPLHAPKASVPQSTAKSRIATVTRTDSTQAAAAGIGKARPDDDVHKVPGDTSPTISRMTSRNEGARRAPSTEPMHPLRERTSFNRSSTSLPAGTSRPGSIHEGSHELGIPEIGMQIPLNPNAGDVQAPSPAPTQSQFTPGIGFFNDGSQRNHFRKRSSRQEFGPPGSYGLHGHGQEPQDQFEKDWAAKHPQQAAMDNVYGHFNFPRSEHALSSDELNRLVKQGIDVGMGRYLQVADI